MAQYEEWQEHLRQGRLLQSTPELAAIHFQMALELAPEEAEAKFALAQIWLMQSDTENWQEALSYLQALHQDSQQNIEFRFYLALCYDRLNDLPQAQTHAQAILRQQTLHGPARLLLARIEKRLQLLEFSIVNYRKYLQLQPMDLMAMEELASVLEQNQQPLEAADLLFNVYRQNPEQVDILVRWLQLKAVGDPVLMMQIMIQVARESPQLRSRIAVQMASVMEHASDTEERQRCLEMALEDPLLPDRPAWKLRMALNIPYLPQSTQEITVAIEHLEVRLKEFENHLPEGADIAADYTNLYPYLRTWTPLNFLPYLNIDPLNWRQRWSHLFNLMLPAQTRKNTHSDAETLRFGFVLNQNTSTRSFLIELLRHWPQCETPVKICVFMNPPPPGHMIAAESQALRQDFEHSVLPEDPAQAMELLQNSRLDFLFLSEVHTDQLMQSLLAMRRIAPIQATSWLSSGTSGSPFMDYFISSHLLEQNENPQRFYSETLIQLDEIPTYILPPVMLQPPPPRSDYGLPDGNLYVCPHLIYKLHPDFDKTLEAILEQDPQGQLVLLSNPDNRFLRNRLLARLEKTFPQLMPRIWFLPKLSHQDYLGLLTLADVMLDPFYFGGGTSSYEAFYLGVPVITWPGERLHGRITYAYYRKMEIFDAVAHSADDYARLAIELATNTDKNQALRQRIKTAQGRLFDNQAAANTFAKCLIELVQTSRQTH